MTDEKTSDPNVDQTEEMHVSVVPSPAADDNSDAVAETEDDEEFDVQDDGSDD